MRGAGEVSWPASSSSGGVSCDPVTGVCTANDELSITGTTNTGSGTSTHSTTATPGYNHTAQDWSRVGTAVITAGTTAALGIFARLNAADQARAYQDNAAALGRLSSSFGFSGNPGAQNEYAARAQLQQLMDQQQRQQTMKTVLYVGGTAVLVLGLAYAFTRKDS